MVNLNEEISRIKSIMGVITESDKFGMSDTFKKLKKTIEVLKEKANSKDIPAEQKEALYKEIDGLEKTILEKIEEKAGNNRSSS